MLDLTSAVCGPAICDPARGGIIIYREPDHLTTTFAGSLAPLLAKKLDDPKPLNWRWGSDIH